LNTANINQLPDQYLALGLEPRPIGTALVTTRILEGAETGVIGGQRVALQSAPPALPRVCFRQSKRLHGACEI